ncbi:MAG TPA: GNAT family N-acetyltransferase [Acidimicrobiia bacterium]|nr:GNAT family N-acetyltransferase [Acidimicrobiia bacterium]
MDVEVRDNPEESRYEIWRGGELAGHTDYKQRVNRIHFVHAEVDPKFRGEGLAERLVRGALDDARRRHLRVVSHCPYVSKFLDDHPEYQDLTQPQA